MSIDHNETTPNPPVATQKEAADLASEVEDLVKDYLFDISENYAAGHAGSILEFLKYNGYEITRAPAVPAPEIREARTWTKEPPNAPGWYWMHRPSSKFFKIKRISLYDSGILVNDERSAYDLRYYPNYDWSGPIPQPQGPKAEGGKV